MLTFAIEIQFIYKIIKGTFILCALCVYCGSIKMHTTEEKLQEFQRLLEIMTELRAKCPWDKEQTFESLRTLTIEETYELADAIIENDKKEIRKELGDILLHIVFYSEMGSETFDFDIYDVCKGLCEKLIYRHPHIFADVTAEDSETVMQNWEQLKLKEKGGNKSVLSGVPASLPALIKAHRIQDKARSVGFDWEEREQVWDKVQEEIDEFKAEVAAMDKDKMEAEFGDMLFSLINAARLYDINPENALERTNRKFISRFNYLESKTITIGKDLKAMTLAEMDVIWNEAKKEERKNP
jgi:MazG family protein